MADGESCSGEVTLADSNVGEYGDKYTWLDGSRADC